MPNDKHLLTCLLFARALAEFVVSNARKNAEINQYQATERNKVNEPIDTWLANIVQSPYLGTDTCRNTS